MMFGIDSFGKQKSLTQAKTVAQMVINLLLMRPGQMPSLPHLGINIKQYLYKFEEDIDVGIIKNAISSQCSALLPYIDLPNLQVLLVPYENESILFIYMPLTILVENETLVIGFKRNNKTSEVTFNYKLQSEITA